MERHEMFPITPADDSCVLPHLKSDLCLTGGFIGISFEDIFKNKVFLATGGCKEVVLKVKNYDELVGVSRSYVTPAAFDGYLTDSNSPWACVGYCVERTNWGVFLRGAPKTVIKEHELVEGVTATETAYFLFRRRGVYELGLGV